MKAEWLKDFKNPGCEYRGMPFWAWNGKLEPEELRRQIRIMKSMGLGGFFMHSRFGLSTPYLAREWFECIGACIDEAEKLRMQAWLYDEDRWPSGPAGGLVTKNKKFCVRCLTLDTPTTAKTFKWADDTVAVFAVELSDNKILQYRRLSSGKKIRLAAGESLWVFRRKIPPPSDWYNGYNYLDCLNPDAVKEFITVTHEAYKKHVGRHFGGVVPGFFTDEPYHAGFFGGDCSVPWTDRLPEAFRKRYGYDILDFLPEVFHDRAESPVSEARYHFHDCVTHLFVQSFSRQIGEWCSRNGLQYTGHIISEDCLSSQTQMVGSGMRFYEYMHIPGMDLLTEHWRIYDTAKQVSSAARQFGRKWRLTETYGCTGWDFPFAGHKALGDWQAALGINVRCQHLAWYTMEGESKRDYPASISYQSPWWRHYSKVENYFARIHAVMSRGEEIRDLLVIHPVESMWLLCHREWKERNDFRDLDKMLQDLRDSLLIRHLDFDYGDEEIMSRHAGVINTGHGARLKVGQALYKAVIVPPQITIRGSTLKLLKQFKEAGGQVVFAGPPPKYVDARPSARAVELAGRCVQTPCKGPKLTDGVEQECRRLSVADAAGNEIPSALYLLREDREAFYLFICNTGHSEKQLSKASYKGKDVFWGMTDPQIKDVGVSDRRETYPAVNISTRIDTRGYPLELDPDSGKIMAAQAKKQAEGWRIETSLPALGSRLFIIPKNKTTSLPPRQTLKDRRTSTLNPKHWKIILTENNNLALDRPEFKIGGQRPRVVKERPDRAGRLQICSHGASRPLGESGPCGLNFPYIKIGAAAWRKAADPLVVDRQVRDALGLKHRDPGETKQPWACPPESGGKSVPVVLGYRFKIDALPSGGLCLGLEQPQRYRIRVNGFAAHTDMDCGWWTDRSLRKIPIDNAFLRIGINEITLTCEYDAAHPGFEIVYLLGNFGVKQSRGDFALTRPPASLTLGDWTKQGLPFYSGTVIYHRRMTVRRKKNERVFVRLPGYEGIGVRILIDGKEAGVAAWEPNEVEITKWLVNESVNLGIEVLGHRRNSHGPLHLRSKKPYGVGPGSFAPSGENPSLDRRMWTDKYMFVGCGLTKPPQIIVRAEGVAAPARCFKN